MKFDDIVKLLEDRIRELEVIIATSAHYISRREIDILININRRILDRLVAEDYLEKQRGRYDG